LQHCPVCQSRFTSEARVCPFDGNQLEALPDPLVGRTIGGRYVVSELIGTGGMGAVYRGRHQLVGRDVALKFLSPRYARDPAARERFLREARAANRIDHEHIIDITDFGETSDGLVFLVMEYLEGEPLGKVIEAGALEPVRALTIAHQLATALARAHELDVIHRDVKPDNVFVLQRRGADFVKLLDFGLAKVVGEHRLTATGKVFGTPEYLAPEQARGEPLTGQADQYALGCVLYEMLTASLPFEGPAPEVVLKHLQALPMPPSDMRPDLPLRRKLDALVLRMLAKHPGERFSDAYHLADELSSLLDELQGTRPSRPPRRSGMMSVPLVEPQATQPWLDAAEESWATRLDLYQSMLPRAYPSGSPPSEVRGGLAEMVQLVNKARMLRKELGENLLRAKEHEDHVRAARLRMGRAVDELGQDESRVARRIADATEGYAQAESRLNELAQPLIGAIHEFGMQRGGRFAMNTAMAERLRQVGGQAALWLEAEAQLPTLRARVHSAEREREDLSFQVAQLKGRLGIVTAEAESDLLLVRQRVEELETELSRALQAVHDAAEPVVRALSALPSMRDVLSTARLPSPGKGPSTRAKPG
jgi:serine/threonine protein kinase